MACCQVGSRALAVPRLRQHCSSVLMRTCLPPKGCFDTSELRQGQSLMSLLQNPDLPSAGEEVVTKESFVSVCWRLIPYWLNNWEQQWGAECSSMMFELPHFAIELLVVLPCVQVTPPQSCGAGGVL